MNFIPLLFYSFAFFLLVGYVVFMAFAVVGFVRKAPTVPPNKTNLPVDIIIAFRDEAAQLNNLLQSIENQTHPNIRVLWVDDHSADNGAQLISAFARRSSYAHVVLQNSGQGKKAAVRLGIEYSSAPLVLFTDADCILPPRWVETYVKYYAMHGDGLYFGPVTYHVGKGLLKQIFSLEFLSLVGTGIGLAAVRHSVYMNGANYGASRKVLQLARNMAGAGYASGDDVFLLHKVKQEYSSQKVIPVNDQNVAVSTRAPHSLGAFLRQRIRWGSKASAYNDPSSVLLAQVVFALAGIQLLSFLFLHEILLFIVLWGVKIIIDFVVLAIFASRWHMKYLLRFFPVVVVLYPLYIVSVAFAGFVSEPG
ncbi:MAG: glycosyltransferase, partial [Salinivirgaceae bacterium]